MYKNHTLPFKSLGLVRPINMFESLLSSPRLNLFDQKYSKIVKYYYI